MSAVQQELEQEIKRLRLKCNKQVDFIREQQEQIQQLKKPNRFLEVFELFYLVVSELMRRDAFFYTKKSTENTRRYKFAKYLMVKELLNQTDTKLQEKYIFEMWVSLGLIGVNENGQIQYSYYCKGHAIRCIRFAKVAVELVKDSFFYEA